ncbi:HAMP domain-containing histidine kinase [Amycolatopsis acidiphila]|uniref:sensor histidine kinase n=1 Tax=Amycolatopsis acidiphila TaxID=715473 RepID=UPI0019C25209|nr:HAMP domain-containing sensor histidine kinase [Amycolatopsis acidiphila]UIJ61734.1 HAMP domain-containing histidine kinase [Amycolatopsis acidiphila]GHG58146.1 sensor histidine kinase [Amycolatopsis acidiphila]
MHLPKSARRVRPLRTKLIAALVALLTVVCLVIGVISEFALGAFLTRQVDDQLHDTVSRSQMFTHGDHGQGNALDALGTTTGTIHAWTSGPAPHADILATEPGSHVPVTQPLGDADLAVLIGVPVDGQPRTVSLSGGEYRVLAISTDDGVELFGLPMDQANTTLVTVGSILGGVAAAAVLGAGVVGAFVVRRTLRPLDRVAAAASKVTELPLDRGDVALSVRVPVTDTDPTTEVGQVGYALNRMLGHIDNALDARKASETRVRQFVADASHELRTPLAAIRGYAELTRRSNGRVPPDVAHAMNRVESEAARMSTLVDDLLLLARLDAGRPLERSEVDLSRLVADAVGDAHIAGPQHRWRLELPGEPVVVPGDAQRLHQVLANLLANGRTHTPPGTTVTTRLAVAADGSAVLTVTDNGPGIAPELLPNVFERFARGDSSRSRAAGSTGLGMAIAAAVVSAHHGQVHVRSRPGRTEFEVRLPRTGFSQGRHNNGQGRAEKVNS